MSDERQTVTSSPILYDDKSNRIPIALTATLSFAARSFLISEDYHER